MSDDGFRQFQLEVSDERQPSPIGVIHDPEKVRPLRDLVYVRIQYKNWTQSKHGIFLPPSKDGRKLEVQTGVFSKTESLLATVLAVGPDVPDSIQPWMRVVLPTARWKEACAVGDTVFNHYTDKDGGTYEQFNHADVVQGIVTDETPYFEQLDNGDQFYSPGEILGEEDEDRLIEYPEEGL